MLNTCHENALWRFCSLLQRNVSLIFSAEKDPDVAGDRVAHRERGRVAGDPDSPLLPVVLALLGPAVHAQDKKPQEAENTKEDLQDHLLFSLVSLPLDVFYNSSLDYDFVHSCISCGCML